LSEAAAACLKPLQRDLFSFLPAVTAWSCLQEALEEALEEVAVEAQGVLEFPIGGWQGWHAPAGWSLAGAEKEKRLLQLQQTLPLPPCFAVQSARRLLTYC